MLNGNFILVTTHLSRLEAEAIEIMREVVSEAENPVMLYSVGKDSAVMLHLAKKAFYPSPPPFPLMHVDTTWKFQEMYKLRDKVAKGTEVDLIVHQNPDAKEKGINPFDFNVNKLNTPARPFLFSRKSVYEDIYYDENLKLYDDYIVFIKAFELSQLNRLNV